jgi:hypothetical protein
MARRNGPHRPRLASPGAAALESPNISAPPETRVPAATLERVGPGRGAVRHPPPPPVCLVWRFANGMYGGWKVGAAAAGPRRGARR